MDEPTSTLTPEVVATERTRLGRRSRQVVDLANNVRDGLGESFGVDLPTVTGEQYERMLDASFADGARGVNVACLARLLRRVDVADDYPGFVVDELLGRELAAMLAGAQPLRLLAEATFHYADIHHDDPVEGAGTDDLDAALAAGVQTRAPGWPWRETDPFGL